MTDYTPTGKPADDTRGIPKQLRDEFALIQAAINSKQNSDADLSAISEIVAIGVLVRTGAGAYALRTITAGTGISITNGDGVSGNPTISVSPLIGTGDVLGDASSTDNAIARFNSTTGKILQNSGITIDDSNNVSGVDARLSRMMLVDTGIVFLDKGNSGTSPQTLSFADAAHQRLKATGNHSITLSGWPPAGNTGILLLEAEDFGAHTITWVTTVNWIKPDGTTTTNVSTWLAAMTGRTAFQSSGKDFLVFFTRDNGSPVYGGFAK